MWSNFSVICYEANFRGRIDSSRWWNTVRLSGLTLVDFIELRSVSVKTAFTGVGRNHKDWKPNIPSFFSSFQSSILLCYFPWATIIDSTIFQSVDQIWCFYSNCASFNTSNIGYLWTHSYNIVINFNQITIVQLDKCNERCKYIYCWEL